MTTTVRAAVATEAGAIPSVEEIVLSDLEPHEVLIRVESSGICHTDQAIAGGELWPCFPVVLGHEICGVIEDVGSAVTRVKKGQRVVTLDDHCGWCAFCETGQIVLCKETSKDDRQRHFRAATGDPILRSVGGFSEATIFPETGVITVPDDVPADVAAIVGCSVTTGTGAVFNTAKVAPGSTVAVVGCGGVGVSALMAAKVAGAGRIVAVDPSPERRERALKMGATDAVEPTDEAVLGLEPEGFDTVIEAAGRLEAMELGVRVLRRGGAMVLIGVAVEGTRFQVDPLDFLLNQKRLLGCLKGDLRPNVDFPRVWELYRRGLLDLDSLVTATFPLDDFATAWQTAARGEGIRTLIRM